MELHIYSQMLILKRYFLFLYTMEQNPKTIPAPMFLWAVSSRGCPLVIHIPFGLFMPQHLFCLRWPFTRPSHLSTWKTLMHLRCDIKPSRSPNTLSGWFDLWLFTLTPWKTISVSQTCARARTHARAQTHTHTATWVCTQTFSLNLAALAVESKQNDQWIK